MSQPIDPPLQTPPANIWLFVNRRAGAFNWDATITELVDRLQADGHQVQQESNPQGFLDRLSRLDSEGELPDLLISAGGDGTATALVNATAGEVPLAIFPIGTENVYAKYLGITTSIEDFLTMLREGKSVRFDLGRANQRLFLLMFGSGFDAQVVRDVHQDRTGHITKLHYLPAFLRQLCRYPYPELEIDLELEDGSTVQTTGRWCFVFNIARYALGIRMVPEAVPNDGLLDVCVLDRGGLWSMLGYAWTVLWGGLDKHPHARSYRIRKASVRSIDGSEVPVQVDGDPTGHLPSEIEVLPGGLTLIVPPNFSIRTA